jgi:hypothetical protein
MQCCAEESNAVYSVKRKYAVVKKVCSVVKKKMQFFLQKSMQFCQEKYAVGSW